MTMACKGLAKLVEGCDELQQIAGEKIACPENDVHDDGKLLIEQMERKMGDVLAAMELVIVTHSLNVTNIRVRKDRKLRLFASLYCDPNL